MLLWAMGTLCLVASIGADNAPAQTCMTNLTSGNVQASSETRANTAHALYTAGWCAGTNDKNQWIEVTFNGGIGLKSVTVGSLDSQQKSYPKEVLVKYVPLGGTQLIDFPFESGSLVIKLDKFGAAISSFNSGIAISKLRFSLKDFENFPCMKVQLKGCTVKELCPVCVNGACVHENNCQCNQGYVGAGCDRKDCTPGPLGLGDGSLPSNQIQVSSEVSGHTKEEIRLDDKNQKIGWCPAVSDKSPWVTIHLDKPNNIRMLNFQFPKRQEGENKMYMSKFELLYIAPQDSTRMFRSFATDIPSMNETHYFQVTLVPGVVTDTLKIRASSFVERACFRLKLAGCDPENLCSPGWCQNNGTCIGQNTCKCEQGFFGERCDETKNQIKSIDAKFLQITQTVLITTTFNFTISGHVTLQTIGNFPVLILNGTNSFVQLKQSSAASLACLLDVNMCKSGFTFAIDVKFEKLLDNTYILSSGGNLVDHHGIALYYFQKHLIYIVTTSTFRWTLQVPYTPVLHQWQHFEITWNKGFGVELHVNGHLLGTFGRPDPISANQKVELCIGCSHSNVLVDISMQIKEFHTWTIDRTELVNAGLKPAPTVPGVTQASTTTPAATVALTTTPLPTTPSKGYQEFNLTFTTIIGNLLITPTFNFTLHGKPVLDLEPNGHTAIVLDCQKQQYIELPDEGIPCLEDMAKCTKGFTFHLEIQFTSIDVSKKTYILSSGGDVEGASGMAIYIHSEQLIFGVKQGMFHWTGTYNMTGIIQTKVWYKMEISWSADKGISALIDGYEVIQSNSPTPSPAVAKTNAVLIGKTAGNDYTSCMKVRNLFTWTVHREVLVDSGILHNSLLTKQPSTTASTTAKPTTTKATTIKTTTKEPGPLTPYDLSFKTINGDRLLTYDNSFTFLIHGKPSLASFFTPKVLTLHGNNGDYLELTQTGVKCVDNFDICHDGFTVEIGVGVLSGGSGRQYIFSNSGEGQGHSGMFLYYEGSMITCGFGYGINLWQTSFNYKFSPGSFNTFLLSWSQTEGLVIYIDYILMKQVPTSVTAQSAHRPGYFTIGNTHKLTNTSNFLLFGLKFWRTSFQYLLQHTVFTTVPTTPVTSKTSSTSLPSSTLNQVLQLISTSSYNLTFTAIKDNLILTPIYSFLVTGYPVLHTLTSGETALQLNTSKGQYIQVANSNITCVYNLDSCSHGFTFQIKVSFQKIDYTQKVYLIENHGKSESFYVYYYNNHLFFGTHVGHTSWSANITYNFKFNVFQRVEFSWSRSHGIQLYMNGVLLKASNHTSTVDTPSQAVQYLSIGKVSGASTTVMMVTGIHFWSVSHQILIDGHALTTQTLTSTLHPTSTGHSTVKPTSTVHADAQTNATGHSTLQTKATGHSTVQTQVTDHSTVHPSPTDHSTIHQSVTGHTTVHLPATGQSTVQTTSTGQSSVQTKSTSHSAVRTTSVAQPNFNNTTMTLERSTTNSMVHITTNNYHFHFQKLTGNMIITTAFSLFAHGNITIESISSNQTAVRVNSSKGEYIEVKNSSITCITSPQSCRDFVVMVNVKILSTDHTSKTYILVSSGGGPYVYYENSTFHFGYIQGHMKWSSTVKYELHTNVWHAYKIEWSKVYGIKFYVDGLLLKSENVSVHTNESVTTTSSLAIGKAIGHVSMLITSLQFQTSYIVSAGHVTTSLTDTTIAPETKASPSKPTSTAPPNPSSTTSKASLTQTTTTHNRLSGMTTPAVLTTTGKEVVTHSGITTTKTPETTTTSKQHLSSSTEKVSSPLLFSTTKFTTHSSTTGHPTTLVGTNVPTTQTSAEVHTQTPAVTNGLATQTSPAVGTQTPAVTNSLATQTATAVHTSTLASTNSLATQTSNAVHISTPAGTNSKTTQTSATKHSTTPVSSYNLGFVNITGSTIFTQTYHFTIQGNVSLITLTTGEKAVQINSSRGEYIELKHHTLTCALGNQNCTKGLTIELKINFITIDTVHKTYILQSIADNKTGSGIFLYFFNNTLHFGYTVNNISWVASVSFHLVTSKWYAFEVTWSKSFGIGLYIDGTLVKVSNETKETVSSGTMGSLVFGKNVEINITSSFMISNIQILTTAHETLQHTTTTTSIVDKSTDSSTTTTKLYSTHPIGTNSPATQTSTKVHTSTHAGTNSQTTQTSTAVHTSSHAGTSSPATQTSATVHTSTHAGTNSQATQTSTAVHTSSHAGTSSPATQTSATVHTSTHAGTNSQATQTSTAVHTSSHAGTSSPATQSSATVHTSSHAGTNSQATQTSTAVHTSSHAGTSSPATQTSATVHTSSHAGTNGLVTQTSNAVHISTHAGTNSLATQTSNAVHISTPAGTNSLATHTSNAVHISTPAGTNSKTTQTSGTRHSTTPVHSYNLGFVNITGSTIFTQTYHFTIQGNVSLITLTTGEKAVQINSSRGEYIELKHHTLTCALGNQNCTKGLTIELKINFITIDTVHKTYILQSIADNKTGSGIFLYFFNNTLHFGYTVNNISWVASVSFHLITSKWYAFEVTWSKSFGIGLYIDGTLVKVSNETKETVSKGTMGSLVFGKNVEINITSSFMISSIQILTTAHETLKHPTTTNLVDKNTDSSTIITKRYSTDPAGTNIPATQTSTKAHTSSHAGTNSLAAQTSTKVHTSSHSGTNSPATQTSAKVHTSSHAGTNSPATQTSTAVHTSSHAGTTSPATQTSTAVHTSIHAGTSSPATQTSAKVHTSIHAGTSSPATQTSAKVHTSIHAGTSSPATQTSANVHTSSYAGTNSPATQTSTKVHTSSHAGTSSPATQTSANVHTSSHAGTSSPATQTSTKVHTSSHAGTSSPATQSSANVHTSSYAGISSPVTQTSTNVHTSSHAGTSSPATQTSAKVHISTTADTNSETTQTSVTKLSTTPVNSYNLGFVNITGSTIFTQTYHFTIQGNVSLITLTTGEKAVQINSSRGEYIELKHHTLTCALGNQNCTKGLTIELKINFITIDTVHKTYILQSIADNKTGSGIFLYFFNNTLHFGYTVNNISWLASVSFHLITSKWYAFEVTWSKSFGIGLYIDGTLVKVSNETKETVSKGTMGSLVFGKNVEINITSSFMISNIQILTTVHETMQHPTNTTSSVDKSTESSTTTTKLHSTHSISTDVAFTMTAKSSKMTEHPSTASSITATESTSSKESVSMTNPSQSSALHTHTATTTVPVLSSRLTDRTTTTKPTSKAGNTKSSTSGSPITTGTGAGTGTTRAQTNTGPTVHASNVTTKIATTPKPAHITLSTVQAHSTPTLHLTKVEISTTVRTQTPQTGMTSSALTKTSTVTPGPEGGTDTVKHTTLPSDTSSPSNGSTPSSGQPTTAGSHTKHSLTNSHSTLIPQQVDYHSYNFSFVNITGNLIYTPSYVITTHGSLVLENRTTGETAVKLNGTKGDFLEVKTQNISCVDTTDNCTHGFTVLIKVAFISIDIFQRNYIIVSSGKVPGTTGMYLYYQNNTLHFATVYQHKQWTSSVRFEITENVWHRFELTWSLTSGLGLYIDGSLVQSTNVSTAMSTNNTAKPGSLLIGKAQGASYTASMMVTGLQFWSASRQILYNTQSTEPMPTTPIPTTTLKPIPHFTWNFTQALGAHVTVHGATTITNSGISVTNSTQYIDFGITNLGCLINPDTCTDGLTIMFTIVFHRLDENTYLLTTGGQLPDGVGLAVLYRFNQVQFILSTTTQSWFATCHRNQVQPNKPHTIMITWQVNLGLEVYINNVLVDSSTNSTSHTATTATTNTVHFGGQTVVTTTTNVKVEYVLQSITFWYAHLQILVDRGICQPPVKPTDAPTTKPPMTPKPTTKAPATPKPTTAATMFPKTSPQTCPVGCVSVASTTQPPPTTPTKKPATTPTKKPTPPVTPPAPDTATPSAKPTTERGPPNYVTNPSLSPIVGNDTKAYLACVFKDAGRDVVFTVSLLIDGKVVDQKTNPGYTGLVLFAVSKLDRNLMNKRIQCSVYARYVGGTHITVAFPSNIVIPKITVTPNRITVTEGKTSEFVTVKSTAPPQFYCCQGCKADCHVHIVGSFHYSRHQQKCNGNYIAQSLIVSKKPPHYNNPICGFPLTGTNWELNKIEVKATIDNRRDGDHTNTMEVIGHVYNQPSSAQITVKPSSSFTVSTVQVTAKDNDASATCKSVNDPHLRTFDGMNYNNMNEGVYMLYKHTTLPFEVRALYHQCSKNHHHHHATCNCAVAVKSGDDVITVSGCQGTNSGHHGHGHGIGLIMQQLFGHKKDELARTPMTIQIYKNGDFTPGTIVRRFGCGQKYEIELPTGLIVTVQQSYKPFINIFLRGSSSDRGKSDGLCGNFDGNRRNDLKPSTSSFINRNKREYENFFYGVGVSSQQFLQTYCSCIKGKNKVCLSGIGAMRCVQTRNDITASLVKQAKRPILTRHKRQADIQATLPPTNIPTDGPLKTDAEALQECTDHITNSPMTVSCTPILTSNTTEHIQNCVNDYMATGSFEWAKDALRDIAVECVDNINDFRAANESGNTNVTDEIDIPDAVLDTIDEILNKSCVDDCGSNGHCEEAVCVCDDGFSGVNCNISKETIPIISIVPFLCDMSQTSDCQGAMVFGEHFVDTPNLTCHYEFVEVGTDVTKTGETGQLKATFITINQVQCQLPQARSAQLMISNDGVKPSPNMSMQVVFNSVCTECSVDGTTFKPSCSRKPNNCMIGGMCYGDGDKREGDPCQVCRPAANDSVWSKSYETMCKETVTEIVTVAQKMVTDDDDDNKNTTLALAIVCGVLAAVIVIGAICLIRKHGASKSTKGEFGSYDLSPSLHRNELKGASNATYSDDM